MAAGNVHPSSPTLHISDTRHATASSVKSQTAGKIAPRPLRLPLANLPLNASEDLASLPTESIVTESLVNLPLPASEDLRSTSADRAHGGRVPGESSSAHL